MESLVSIAKRLKIRPNPQMTLEERKEAFTKIYQESNTCLSDRYESLGF